MNKQSPRPPDNPKPSKTTADSRRAHSGSNAGTKRGQGRFNANDSVPSTPGTANSTVGINNNSLDNMDVFANTQKVKTGDRTLLLCMDIDESGASQSRAHEERTSFKDSTFELVIPDIFSASIGPMSSVSGSSMGLDLLLSPSEDLMDKNLLGSISIDAQPSSSLAIIVEEENATTIAASSTAAPPPVVSAPTSKAPTYRRRMSRADQFNILEKSLPNVKLDKQQRKSVVSALIDMNIWNEDDDDDDGQGNSNPSNKMKKGTMSQKNTHKDKHDSPNRKIGTVKLSPTKSSDYTSAPTTLSSTNEITEATSPMTATLTTETSASAAGVREKVPMQRPSQIIITEQSVQRDERQRADRDAVRDTVVQKAVQFIVDLNKKQEMEALKEQQQKEQQLKEQQQKEQQYSSPTSLANKSTKEIKTYTLKKLTASLVDRAMKRGKMVFKKAVIQHQIEEFKYLRRRAQAARFLSRCWKRHCSRHDVHKILAMGRASIEAKKVAEIEEQYQYRIRMAQRRLMETAIHKEWLDEQREFPTFPVNKQVEDRELGPLRMNEDGLAMSRTDAKLFAEDFEHMRPDLAPFSTKINNMIVNSLQEVKRTVEKKRLIGQSIELFAGQQAQKVAATRSRVTSMSNNNEENDNSAFFGSANVSAVPSPRIPSTPPASSVTRSPRTPGSTSMAVNSRMFDFPATSMSLPFPITGPMSNTPLASSYSKQMMKGMRLDEAGETLVQLSLPARVMDRSVSSLRAASLVGWEEMARLDNMPSVEEIKKKGTVKSSAYKVLERLCGLSEEDILMSKLERLKDGREEVSLANSKFVFL